nr:immunoglobulin heavy chain junction region [Macaca mulatta]
CAGSKNAYSLPFDSW